MHAVVTPGERTLTDLDYSRLTKLVGNRPAPLLDDLLSNADITSPRTVRADVVTMNSRVVVQDVENGESSEYTLVFPEQADVEQGRLSVVSPIGTAILGYAKGDVITWQTPGGPRQIQIADIRYQPEAAGDFHL